MIRTTAIRAALLVGTVVLASAPALADKPQETRKGNAKALLQSGLKLFAAKDYLGALAVFKDAYARFPSDKILLNIGTTLIKLERNAEAANAYQTYLDSPDADPAKRADVTRALAELDRRVGRLTLEVTPASAQIQLDDDSWRPADALRHPRVPAGEVRVRARHASYRPDEQVVTVAAGATATVKITLALEVARAVPTGEDRTTAAEATTVTRRFRGPERRARFGALVVAHVDPSNQGAAALVGGTFDVTDRVSVRAAAILGPYFGGYAGASFAFLVGRVRPLVAAGVPMFSSDGLRAAVRGAAGVELMLGPHLSLIAELGVEHLINPQDSIESPTLVVPAVGVTGRL